MAHFDDTVELLTYPSNSISVLTMEDYKCLDLNEKLSGGIIDFFMQYIHREMSEEMRNRVHFCSTSFYNLYALSVNFPGWHNEENKGLTPFDKRYLRVKDLNQGVNMFEKDFIVIPCIDREHWFLAIACFINLLGPVTIDGNIPVERSEARPKRNNTGEPIKQPCILLFNSLKNGDSQATEAIIHIRNFLNSEYKAKHQQDFPFLGSAVIGCHVPCPEQSNAVDCGVFLLEYIDHFFFKSPITDFRLPMRLSNWFDPKIVSKKRGEIAKAFRESIVKANGKLPELPRMSCDDQQEDIDVNSSLECLASRSIDSDELEFDQRFKMNQNVKEQDFSEFLLDEPDPKTQGEQEDSSNKSLLQYALDGVNGAVTQIIGMMKRPSLSNDPDSSEKLLCELPLKEDQDGEATYMEKKSQNNDDDVIIVDSD